MLRLVPRLAPLLLLVGCSSGGVSQSVTPAVCNPETVTSSLMGPAMTVLSLNVAHGRNQSMNQLLVSTEQTRANLLRIADTLQAAQADVVALQEADGPSLWSGSFDHVEFLRDHSGLTCTVLGRHSDSWIASYGTALGARYRLHRSTTVKFAATPPTTAKGFVMAEVLWDAGEGPVPVTVVSVHLDFSRKSVRDKQVAVLLETLGAIDTPLVLMGDMNSYWDAQRSHVRQLAEGLELRAFEPETEGLGTYKSRDGKRLDWILISEELDFVDYRVLPDSVSDHLAVLARLRFRARGDS